MQLQLAVTFQMLYRMLLQKEILRPRGRPGFFHGATTPPV